MNETHIILIDLFFLLILISVISGIYIISSTTLFIRDGNDNDNIINMPFSLSKFVSFTWIMTYVLALIYSFIHNPFIDNSMNQIATSNIYLLAINVISLLASNFERKKSEASHENINNQSSGFLYDITCSDNGFCIDKIQYIIINLWVYFHFVYSVFSLKWLPQISNIEILILLLSTSLYFFMNFIHYFKSMMSFRNKKNVVKVKKKPFFQSKRRGFY